MSLGLSPLEIAFFKADISSKGFKLRRSNHLNIISSGIDIVLPKISSGSSVIPM